MLKKLCSVGVVGLVCCVAYSAWTAVTQPLPSGALCIKGSGYDANRDGVRDTCPPADSFTADGQDYIADVSDLKYMSPVTLTSDSTSPTGHYLSVSGSTGIDTTPVIYGCIQAPTAGTYSLQFVAATPNTAKPFLFYQWDTPIPSSPLTTNATLLNGGQFGFDYLVTNANLINRTDDYRTNAVSSAFLDNQTVTLDTNPHCLYMNLRSNVRLAQVKLTNTAAPPALVSAYDLKKVDTTFPVNCDDTRFPQASALPMTGLDTRGSTKPTAQGLWGVDTGVAYMYWCVNIPEGNLRGVVVADNNVSPPIEGLAGDMSNTTEDAWQMFWRQGTSSGSKNNTTWQLVHSVAGGRSWWTYPANSKIFVDPLTGLSSLVAICANADCSTPGTLNDTTADNHWKLFYRVPIGFTPSDGDLFRAQFAFWDNDPSGVSEVQAFGTGLTANQALWGVLKFSGTVVTGGAGDTTPPSIGTISSGTPGPFSVILTVGLTDTAPSNPLLFNVRYGLTSSYGLTAGPSSLCNSGTNCTLQIQNLLQNTTYHYAIDAQDNAGNVASSTDRTFTTANQTTGALYISPTGSDSNNGDSTHPFKTFDFALTHITAGKTLFVKAGDYTTAANGTGSGAPLINLKCDNSHNPNGGPASLIVIQPEIGHEREAHLFGDGSADTIKIDHCQYYQITGLYVSTHDFATNTTTGDTIKLDHATNITFSRMLIGMLLEVSDPYTLPYTYAVNNCVLQTNGAACGGNNRNAPTHAIHLVNGSDSATFIENEVYDYSGDGLLVENSNSGVLQRNIFNSRNRKDLVGAVASTDNSRGDAGILLSPGANWAAMNNVTKNNSVGRGTWANGTGNGSADGNVWYGEMSTLDGYGFYSKAVGTTVAGSPHNEKLVNFISYKPNISGVVCTGCVNFQVTNLTVNTPQSLTIPAPSGNTTYNPANSVDIGVGAAGQTGDPAGPSLIMSQVFIFANTAIGKIGLRIDPLLSSWSVSYPYVVGNTTNYSPVSTDTHYSNVISVIDGVKVGPEVGMCVVSIPSASPLHQRGASCADVGANALYEYTGTSPSNVTIPVSPTQLWDSDTYSFPCGAQVTGVNDTAATNVLGRTDSCAVVSRDFHAGTADPRYVCQLPYGTNKDTPVYNGTSITTQQNTPGAAPPVYKTTYVSHLGVPDPPFGVTETAPARPSPWDQPVPGYFYVDYDVGSDFGPELITNGVHSCGTGTAPNKYGTPLCPRKTIPIFTSATGNDKLLLPGSVFEVHGWYRLGHTGGNIIRSVGTSGPMVYGVSGPVFIRGQDASHRPIFNFGQYLSGSYLIFENAIIAPKDGASIGGVTILPSQCTTCTYAGFTAPLNNDHIVVRHVENVGLTGLKSYLSAQVTSNSTGENDYSVFWDDFSHHIGNFLWGDEYFPPIRDQDSHCFSLTPNSNFYWLLDSHLYRCAGDGLQINGNIPTRTDEVGTLPQRIWHSYVAGNYSHNHKQYGMGTKFSTATTFSENVLRKFRVSSSSTGGALFVMNSGKNEWVIYNDMADAEIGYRGSEDGCSGPTGCFPPGEVYDNYMFGNIVHDIHTRLTHDIHYNIGSTNFFGANVPYDPSVGQPLTGASIVGENKIRRHIINNTFYDIDAGIWYQGPGTFSGSPSDPPSYNLMDIRNNIFGGFTTVCGSGELHCGAWINLPSNLTAGASNENGNLTDTANRFVVWGGSNSFIGTNAITTFHADPCCSTQGANDIIAGTLGFTNAGGGDYTLTNSSSALNTGLNIITDVDTAYFNLHGIHLGPAGNTSIKDIARNPRTVGGTVDMGAYEKQ